MNMQISTEKALQIHKVNTSPLRPIMLANIGAYRTLVQFGKYTTVQKFGVSKIFLFFFKKCIVFIQKYALNCLKETFAI